MASDSPALSDFRPPDQADYEALLTVLTGSERGRRFLAEYNRRERLTDPQDEGLAVSRALPSSQDDLPTTAYLNEIAAMLGRIVAQLGKSAPPVVAAETVERLHDIAFVLHERAIEPSICDSLDAAVRDAAKVIAHADGAREQAVSAIAMIGALLKRIGEMKGEWANAEQASLAMRNGGGAIAQGSDDGTVVIPGASVNPDEDPGELFDSSATRTQSAADADGRRRDLPVGEPSDAMGKAEIARARNSTSIDPMADVRALSADELVALFT